MHLFDTKRALKLQLSYKKVIITTGNYLDCPKIDFFENWTNGSSKMALFWRKI